MDWAGWALFGLLATAILTAIMTASQLVGWTRLDLPLLLGTMVTGDPDRARVVGFFMHLAFGEGFALGYAAGFALLDTATWWLGALFGLAPCRRRAHDPRSAPARCPPAHGVESGGTRGGRGARAARPSGLELRRADARGDDRVASRVRDRARSAPHGALTCPRARAVRSATTGSSATPGRRRSSPRMERSTGCARRGSTVIRCSAASSAVLRRAPFAPVRASPASVTAPLPAPYRDPRDNLGHR